MSRLIDADALFEKRETISCKNEWYELEFIEVVTAQTIKEAPTIDPVVHGRWIFDKDGNCKCSECLVSYGRFNTPYCPNCGAEMDGGK